MTHFKAFGVLLASVLALGLNLAAPGARAQTSPEGAAQFVESIGNQAVTLLAATRSAAPKKRHAALRELIRDGFNLELTSQFVLGKFWSRATPVQREEFKVLFTEYLLNSYARHLGAVRAETLTIVASHPVGDRDVLVETSLEGAEGITSPVWRVRARDGEYKIIDVSIDGVSLALTHRREFAAVANQRGVDGLLKLLREKVGAQAKAAFRSQPAKGSHVSLLASILASPSAGRIGVLLAAK